MQNTELTEILLSGDLSLTDNSRVVRTASFHSPNQPRMSFEKKVSENKMRFHCTLKERFAQYTFLPSLVSPSSRSRDRLRLRRRGGGGERLRLRRLGERERESFRLGDFERNGFLASGDLDRDFDTFASSFFSGDFDREADIFFPILFPHTTTSRL